MFFKNTVFLVSSLMPNGTPTRYEEYGAWSFIVGTLFTAFLRFCFASPFVARGVVQRRVFQRSQDIVFRLFGGRFACRHSFDCLRIMGVLHLTSDRHPIGRQCTGVWNFSGFDSIGCHDYSVCFVAECRIFVDDSRYGERRSVQLGGHASRNDLACKPANGKFGHSCCVYSCFGESVRRNNGRDHAYREHH